MQVIDISYKIGTHLLFYQLHAYFVSGITAIVGANGCGKSTLLRILSGLCQPSDGNILIEGEDLYKRKDLKKHIGYVPANPFLYPYLTVEENLLLCANIKKMNKRVLRNTLATILQQCHLSAYQHIFFGKLSEGLKKRVMIASALIHQPSILILDEPCAELDPFQRQQLWELFQQLQSNNKQIVFSSHHPQEISKICNNMYQLTQGQLQHLPKHQPSSQNHLQIKSQEKATPTQEMIML